MNDPTTHSLAEWAKMEGRVAIECSPEIRYLKKALGAEPNEPLTNEDVRRFNEYRFQKDAPNE